MRPQMDSEKTHRTNSLSKLQITILEQGEEIMPPPKDPIKYGLWKQNQSKSHIGKTCGEKNGKYKQKIQKVCPICQSFFLVKPSHADKRVCCGRECSNVLLSERYSGSGNPSFGKTWKDTKNTIRKKKESAESSWKNNDKRRIETSDRMKKILRPIEWRENQSKALKGRKITWTDKLREAKLGKKLPEETKKKMSESHAGENNYMFGKQHSIETRKQISASHQGIPLDEWEDFTKPLYIQIRNSQKYANWVKAVFEKDNYRDHFSGEKGNGNLNAHHIIHFSCLIDRYNIKTYEDAMACEALWDINNGVTMIDINHIAYHSMGG